MTHLLHQMVHYRTTLRSSEQRSATIARITIHTHNDIKYKKKVIRVLRHAVAPVSEPNPQAGLGAGRYPYSTSSGTKSGSSSVKIKNGVSTYVLSKSNHTHGGGYIRRICTGKSRIRLRFNLQKTIFYAGVYFKEKPFRNQLLQ